MYQYQNLKCYNMHCHMSYTIIVFSLHVYCFVFLLQIIFTLHGVMYIGFLTVVQ